MKENGKTRYLGTCATAEEAALYYARHVGAERAAAEAAEARVAVQQPLTTDEARASAAAEGLELMPSSSSKTGFKGVSLNGNGYQAKLMENGKTRVLGTFASAEEAALYYARHVGAKRAAAEASAEARVAVQQPLTEDDARAAAVAEGLELMPSSSSKTGFKGVIQKGARYKVQRCHDGKQIQQGNFATPWEAALWNARNIKKEQAAAETAVATATIP